MEKPISWQSLYGKNKDPQEPTRPPAEPEDVLRIPHSTLKIAAIAVAVWLALVAAIAVGVYLGAAMVANDFAKGLPQPPRMLIR